MNFLNYPNQISKKKKRKRTKHSAIFHCKPPCLTLDRHHCMTWICCHRTLGPCHHYTIHAPLCVIQPLITLVTRTITPLSRAKFAGRKEKSRGTTLVGWQSGGALVVNITVDRKHAQCCVKSPRRSKRR